MMIIRISYCHVFNEEKDFNWITKIKKCKTRCYDHLLIFFLLLLFLTSTIFIYINSDEQDSYIIKIICSWDNEMIACIKSLKCDVVVDSAAKKVKKFSSNQNVKEWHSQIKADSKNHHSNSLNLTHFNFSNILHNFTFFSIILCITCDLLNIE
jgi:hypothetical protein